MFEPLMQALDTTMTNGRTRKRYVNATWTQHGQWLQTRASPSFITFATPFSLSPSLPLLSPLPSLCLLLPPFFFFFSLLDVENTPAQLTAQSGQSERNPEKLTCVKTAHHECYTHRNKVAIRSREKFSSSGTADRKTALALFKGEVVTGADRDAAPGWLSRFRDKFDTAVSQNNR